MDLDSEAYFYFKGKSSNHSIPMAKIQLNLPRNEMRTIKTAHYNRSLFNDRDICHK